MGGRLRRAGESCANCAYISCNSHGKKNCGCSSYERGPGAPEPVSIIPAQWMVRIKEAFDENADNIDEMKIRQTNDNDNIASWKDWEFIAWGEGYVYFSCESCGNYFVESVPRNP